MGEGKQSESTELERKRRAFRRSMADISARLGELARAIGLSEPEDAMDKPERFLDAVDGFLATTNADALGYNQRLWLKGRVAYFAGELLIRRHGGLWFLQEDAKEQFYLTPVVSGFEDHRSITVSPPAIVNLIFKTNPPGSLREALTRLGFDDADTQPQVDGGLMTGRHRRLVPRVQCTCGRALWDFDTGNKATWLTQDEIDAFRRNLSDRVGAWQASCGSGHREAFLQHVLGMDGDDETITDAAIVAEMVARAMSPVAHSALECESCGRIWLEPEKGVFISYLPETDRRGVFNEYDDPPDSEREPD
jgi:hypothetical protein